MPHISIQTWRLVMFIVPLHPKYFRMDLTPTSSWPKFEGTAGCYRVYVYIYLSLSPSPHGGFLKWGYPQIIDLGIPHYPHISMVPQFNFARGSSCFGDSLQCTSFSQRGRRRPSPMFFSYGIATDPSVNYYDHYNKKLLCNHYTLWFYHHFKFDFICLNNDHSVCWNISINPTSESHLVPPR